MRASLLADVVMEESDGRGHTARVWFLTRHDPHALVMRRGRSRSTVHSLFFPSLYFGHRTALSIRATVFCLVGAGNCEFTLEINLEFNFEAVRCVRGRFGHET